LSSEKQTYTSIVSLTTFVRLWRWRKKSRLLKRLRQLILLHFQTS